MRWLLRFAVVFILLITALAVLFPGWSTGYRLRAPGSPAAQPVEGSSSLARRDTAEPERELPEETALDDQTGIFVSPLLGGLAQLGGQISDATGQADVAPSGSLAAADRQIAQIKGENRRALREVSRPYLRVSPRTPHLLLITVSGLRLEHVTERANADADSALARMYRDGLRYTQYYSRRERDQAWREFQSGLVEPDLSDRNQSLMDDIWKSGYLTSLIGDCSQAPNFRDDDPHYDHRFGVESTPDRDRHFIDQLWSNGKPMEILSETDGSRLPTQDLYLNEAASFIASHRQGRPFFLHLTFDIRVPATASLETRLAQLDRRLDGLMAYLKKKSLEQNIVVLLAGLGTELAETAPASTSVLHPAATRAPLVMYWPGRVIGKSTDVLCSTCDLLPTVAEWTQTPRLPPCDGLSLKPSTLAQRYDPGRVLVWLSANSAEATVVAQKPWLLILQHPPQLFDAVRDSNQSEDLAREIPTVVETLIRYAGVQL